MFAPTFVVLTFNSSPSQRARASSTCMPPLVSSREQRRQQALIRNFQAPFLNMFKKMLDSRFGQVYSARVERVQFSKEANYDHRNSYLPALSGNQRCLDRLGRAHASQERAHLSGGRFPR